MSTLLFTPGASIDLTLSLEDGATTLFPTAWIFAGAAAITSVDLTHNGQGRYLGAWVPAAAVPYDALYIVYTDAGRTTESAVYTREMERWQPDTIIADAMDRADIPGDVADAVWDEAIASHLGVGSTGEFLGRVTAARASNIDDTNTRARLVEKIMRNRLALADGDTGNWVLYDDDSLTPLLTWPVTDKDGDTIIQQKHVPSRRGRGV